MKTKTKKKPKKEKKKAELKYYPDIATTVEEIISWRFDLTNARFLLSQEEQLVNVKAMNEKKSLEIPKVADAKAQEIINNYDQCVRQHTSMMINAVAEARKPERMRPVWEMRKLTKEDVFAFAKRIVGAGYGENASRQIEPVNRAISGAMRELAFNFDIRMLQDPRYIKVQVANPHPNQPMKPIIFTGNDANGNLREVSRDTRRHDGGGYSWIYFSRFPVTRIRRQGEMWVDTYLEQVSGKKCPFGSPGWVLEMKEVARKEIKSEKAG